MEPDHALGVAREGTTRHRLVGFGVGYAANQTCGEHQGGKSTGSAHGA
jgi:hypothetical protein